MRAEGAPYAVKRAVTGLGLFATRPIRKDTRIVEYFGPRTPNEEVEKSSGKYFFEINKRWSIDGSGRDNIARYINHSCVPNAAAIITKDRVWIWSERDIESGEEITYDYGKEYFEGIIKHIGCKCPKCRPSSKIRRRVVSNRGRTNDAEQTGKPKAGRHARQTRKTILLSDSNLRGRGRAPGVARASSLKSV